MFGAVTEIKICKNKFISMTFSFHYKINIDYETYLLITTILKR
jgi:hypothetical protein